MSETTIDTLRDRLATREAELKKLRERLKAAKEAASKPSAKSSISDIQKRYLSAVADLETKKSDFIIQQETTTTTTQAVSKLANQFNKGIDGKKVERINISVKADITKAKKQFSKIDSNNHFPNDSSKSRSSNGSIISSKNIDDQPPAELLVEDDDGLPSWAKNQQKLIIRKENARSSIRDIDINELQDNVVHQQQQQQNIKANDENNTNNEVPRGNVKAALAMWGKTAEEDARILAKKREEEEKRQKELQRLEKLKQEEKRKLAIENAINKFAKLSLVDLTDEPQNNDIELMAFLERKINLVDKEIRHTEEELDKIELGN